eukprot:10080404-Lingulodinium_polyedra.AAC.1
MPCQCYAHAVLAACDLCAIRLLSICDPRRAFRNPRSARRPPRGGCRVECANGEMRGAAPT